MGNININYAPITSWLLKNWSKIALVIVLILYLKSCEGANVIKEKYLELEVKENVYKENAIALEKDAIAFQELANKRKDSIKNLKSEIIEIKGSLAAEKIKAKEKIEKVKNLNSQGIKDYYVDRFQYLDIQIVEQGLVMKDDLNRLIITNLIKGDSSEAQLRITQKTLEKTETLNSQLESANSELEQSNGSFSLANAELKKANEAADEKAQLALKSVQKEKNKKTFWQVVGVAGILTSSFLLITK